MFYSYLWGGGPDKVKMVTVVQGYEQGVLRVIDINKLSVALKITWLRRYFMFNTKYFKLVKVICPCISDFVKFFLNILPSFSKMYEGIYLVFIRSLCIFVDILTVCYTFIHFL